MNGTPALGPLPDFECVHIIYSRAASFSKIGFLPEQCMVVKEVNCKEKQVILLLL